MVLKLMNYHALMDCIGLSETSSFFYRETNSNHVDCRQSRRAPVHFLTGDKAFVFFKKIDSNIDCRGRVELYRGGHCLWMRCIASRKRLWLWRLLFDAGSIA